MATRCLTRLFKFKQEAAFIRQASTGNLWSYDHRPSNHKFIFKTYGEILKESVEKVPDQTAVLSSHQNLSKTFQDIYNDVNKTAAGLLSLGLNKGSNVAVLAPNYYEWVVLQYAIASAGLVLSTLNPALTSSEVLYTLKKSDSQAVVIGDSFKGQSFYDTLEQVIPEMRTSPVGNLKSSAVPTLRYVINMFNDKLPGTINLSEVQDNGSSKEALLALEDITKKITPDDCVNIQFTSGTTGQPKAAKLSHFSILNNARFYGLSMKISNQVDRICLPVPLFHCFGCVLGSTVMGLFSTPIVLPCTSYNPLQVIQAISEHKCTLMYGSPTMFVDVLNHPSFNDYKYDSMRGGVMAASTCPMELLKRVNEMLNLKDMIVVYGTTENSPIITGTDVDDPIDLRCSTVGRASDHIEVKIIDEQGALVKRGITGELCARGYQVMLGYKDDPEKTKEVFGEDRWYKTGDLATMDDEGYIKIVGRIKDMIIRGGENIYPREIEEFLHTHPSITEAQIFGIPDERLGEIVCAWIKIKDDHQLTEKDVREFCADKIAKFKIPAHIRFVDSFPLTTSGKVKKLELTRMMVEKLKL